MWEEREVRKADFRLVREKAGLRLEGDVVLKSDDGGRGYEVSLLGYVGARGGKVTRFDLLAKGAHWGAVRYTSNDPPEGRFTLAIAFTLAGEGEA